MVEWLDGLIAEAKSSWMNPYNTAHSSSRSPDSAVEEEQPEDNDVNDDTELNEVDQLSSQVFDSEAMSPTFSTLRVVRRVWSHKLVINPDVFVINQIVNT